MAANGPAPEPTTSRDGDPSGPLSVKVRNASSGPADDATNPTSTEHFCPAAIGPAMHADAPIKEKSIAFAPVMFTAEIASGAPPVLMAATACGGTVIEFTGCAPKFTFATLNEMLGASVLLGTPSTTNASFNGGVCQYRVQVTWAPLLALPC